MPSLVKYTKTKTMSFTFNLTMTPTYLALILLFHLILTYMSWLQPRKGGFHFILSDNSNHDFDVKVRRCGFVGFVNNAIDHGCLRCAFCFRIKEKEKDTFYINFYSIIFLLSYFFSHYYN